MAPIKPIDKVPVPPPLDRSAGIGRASQNVLVRFVVETFNRLRDGISDMLRHAADSFLESVEKPLVEMAGPIIDDVLEMPGLPASVRSALERTRSGTDQAAVGGLLICLAMVVVMLIPAMLSGVTETIHQISFYLTRPFMLGYATWRAAVLRNPALQETMRNDLRNQGWREDQIAAADLAAEQRLGISDILAAYHRKELTEAEASQRLTAQGVAGSDLALVFSLANRIPGPADLVQFAKREVWRDDVAAKYGYDADYTPQFGEWLEKQGFDPMWARAYHRSRWTLPGIATGLNLLHRQAIDDDEFKDLLMIQDIPKWWREKIIDAAYSPYTRVDVRRMYQSHTIGELEVYDTYRDLGYDHDHATRLTEWTVSEYSDDQTSLTRSAIERAYTRDLVDRAEAVTMLGEVGIRGEAAGLYLDIVDYDKALKRQGKQIDGVEKLFASGQVSESEARSRLVALGVVADRIDDLLAEWQIDKTVKVRMPTRANLESFVKDGVVDPGTYADQMALLGYSDLYIGWYAEAIAMERQEKALDEERKARAEQERLREARTKTEYQTAKAALDVDIAELVAAIAEDQLSIVTAENERDAAMRQASSLLAIAELEREYAPFLREAEAEIASARLEIVNVQSVIAATSATIEQIRQSLTENVDVAAGAALREERLGLQTENARLTELIRQRETVLARLEQTMIEAPGTVSEEEAALIEAEATVEMAEFQERQATNAVRIEEIDEALQATLSEVRRQELEIEQAAARVSVSEANTQIAALRVAIRQAEQARAEYEQEMKDEIAALPGAEEQIVIRHHYDDVIDEIRANIKQYQQNVAELRLAKSRLTADWRQNVD